MRKKTGVFLLSLLLAASMTACGVPDSEGILEGTGGGYDGEDEWTPEAAVPEALKISDSFFDEVAQMLSASEEAGKTPYLTVSVSKTGEDTVLPLDAFLEAAEGEYSDGEVKLESRSYAVEDSLTSRDGVRMVELSKVTDDFGYEVVAESDDSVTLVKRFQTCRLILLDLGVGLDLSADYDIQKLSPVKILPDGIGNYILQFADSYGTGEAYAVLSGKYGADHVEEDKIVSVYGVAGKTNVESESYPDEASKTPGSLNLTKSGLTLCNGLPGEGNFKIELPGRTGGVSVNANHLSYGADRIGVDSFIDNMSDAAKQSRVIVAVVDTGIDTDHSLFSGRIYGGKSVISSSFEDGNGHGTHVSGIICDSTQGTGVMVMPVQCMDASGNGTNLSVATAVNYAYQNGAQVINMSLGGYSYDSSSAYIDSAVKNALNAGVTVVASAGNDAIDTANFCPAHISGLLCVAAVDSNDDRAYFSNYGSNVGVACPGVDIYSSYVGGNYASLSGTSMAAPYASAACALVRESGLASAPSGIMSLIENYCDDVGDVGWDSYYGSGVVNLANMADLLSGAEPEPTSETSDIDPSDPTQPTGSDPTQPSSDPTQPTQPSTQPTQPSTQPTQPTTQPTQPSTQPTQPSTQPTQPSTQPTQPSTQPTQPSTQPTQPSTQPTQPSTQPTQPSTQPTQPTQPSTQPTQPSTQPTQPSTQPTQPSQPSQPSYEPIVSPGVGGISVSVSTSSSNGVGRVSIKLVTAGDISQVDVTIDGRDYSNHIINDGNGNYHIDTSGLSGGSHSYCVRYGNSVSSGSFSF